MRWLRDGFWGQAVAAIGKRDTRRRGCEQSGGSCGRDAFRFLTDGGKKF